MDRILSDRIRICLQILMDINIDTDIFLANTNMNMIFNLKLNTDMNTDNYSELDKKLFIYFSIEF
jgi:hypothetical protein